MQGDQLRKLWDEMRWFGVSLLWEGIFISGLVYFDIHTHVGKSLLKIDKREVKEEKEQVQCRREEVVDRCNVDDLLCLMLNKHSKKFIQWRDFSQWVHKSVCKFNEKCVCVQNPE